ncbi:MAG TPA: hypothetical protein VGU73_12945 [Acidimicrobiia bacterium]|nr:hypothetical protein [Acidimicrobiia bacterium]
MSPGPSGGSDPRADAQARLDALAPGTYSARVLEPSPPAVAEPPWFADDPVNAPAPTGRRPVSPVSGPDPTWDELARGDAPFAAWCAERWLGAWPALAPITDDDAWTTGRGAWHALAEHVLAPARHQCNGKIGLRFTCGGVGTPFTKTPRGVLQVRLDRTELVVTADGDTRVPITTLRAAHEVVGLPLEARTGLYEETTPDDPDAPLTVTADVAARLAAWYGFAASVLEELRAGAPDGAIERVQIWPEHFDVSLDLGDVAMGQRGTFGASPGDAMHTRPYLYVTHWADVAPDAFWNDTAFEGASLPYDELVGPSGREDALRFLRRGVAALGGP